MSNGWPMVPFRRIVRPNSRPYLLGADEDADLVGMRLYGHGPFHRERKLAMRIQKKSHFVIRSGDVIYNKLFAWKGTFGVVPPELDGMYVSDKFPTYAVNEELVCREYLRWYFRHPPLWSQAQAMSTGSAALSKLTLNPPRFLDLEVPLPPLSEQRRIVVRIESLATKIAEARKHSASSISTAAAFWRSALTASLKSFALDRRLEDVLLDKPRNGWSPKCVPGTAGTCVLALGAVTGFAYRSDQVKCTPEPTTLHAHYWLTSGDLLITRSNSPELVGHAAIYDGKPSPCIYPDLMMKLQVDAKLADTRFVHLWLQSSVVRDFIAANAKGTSPSMKKISQGVVAAIPFPQVGLTEQRRIVAHLDALTAKTAALKQLQSQSAAELEALLPSILDRAFKGEL